MEDQGAEIARREAPRRSLAIVLIVLKFCKFLDELADQKHVFCGGGRNDKHNDFLGNSIPV